MNRNQLVRVCTLAIVLAVTAVAGAGSPPFNVVSDELDPQIATATLPAGPVEQALLQIRRDAPHAVVLVPTRVATQDGRRYALAAWRSDAGVAEWDALLVIESPQGARLLEVTSSARDIETTLAAVLTHALGSSTPPLPPVAAAVVDKFPLPTVWDVRYVVLLERNPDYVAPADPAAATALTEAHIQYTLRLQREGTALVAGPLSELMTAPASNLIGITVLRAKDLATAERIAAEDPAVKAGRLRATVREWNIPAGRLP